MKTKLVCLLGLAIAGLSPMVSAQVVTTSYCDVFPATQSRLTSISDIRKVEDTAVASVLSGSGSFATTVVFPDGTTSAVFATANTVRSSNINGVVSTLPPVDMQASKFNPEGDISLPSLFYKNAGGTIVVPVNSNFVATALINPKTVYITEQRATLPQLLIVGDYWQLSRNLSGTYILNGVSTPFSVTDTTAKVVVVDETDAPVASVSMTYPVNPKINSVTHTSTTITLLATGLTADSYNQTWWMETSIDLVTWGTISASTVGPDVTITFPIVVGENKRFYRVKGLIP